MLTVYRPQRNVVRRSSLFRDLFDDMFMSGWESGHSKAEDMRPAVDMVEQDGAYEIHADLPGVDEKDVEVSLQDGLLTIHARRESSTDEERDGFKLRERYHGTYSRSFRLGSKVDSEKIEANYNNGVLRVVIPKVAEAHPRQIPVTVN